MNESLETNKRQAYLAKAHEKIFEVVHFCEEQYICREYILAKYFAWNYEKLFLSCDFLSIWSDVQMVFFKVITRFFLNTYSLGYSAFKPEELDLPVGAVGSLL